MENKYKKIYDFLISAQINDFRVNVYCRGETVYSGFVREVSEEFVSVYPLLRSERYIYIPLSEVEKIDVVGVRIRE